MKLKRNNIKMSKNTSSILDCQIDDLQLTYKIFEKKHKKEQINIQKYLKDLKTFYLFYNKINNDKKESYFFLSKTIKQVNRLITLYSVFDENQKKEEENIKSFLKKMKKV